jgi:hypothetical protein
VRRVEVIHNISVMLCHASRCSYDFASQSKSAAGTEPNAEKTAVAARKRVANTFLMEQFIWQRSSIGQWMLLTVEK